MWRQADESSAALPIRVCGDHVADGERAGGRDGVWLLARTEPRALSVLQATEVLTEAVTRLAAADLAR